ncbi:hypothetical protein LJC51_06905, partial [Lachnospiraceae bacterium OttesenSCG-928-J05]|nr:hypothetical protein [Lachnospiraceae bacterium OttesenSCG-928-J05]
MADEEDDEFADIEFAATDEEGDEEEFTVSDEEDDFTVTADDEFDDDEDFDEDEDYGEFEVVGEENLTAFCKLASIFIYLAHVI